MVRGVLVCLALVSLASAQHPRIPVTQPPTPEPPTAPPVVRSIFQQENVMQRASIQDCALGTAIYRNGDDNRDSCLVMRCNNGDWEYTGEIREHCGNCTVQGDPHFWTFDYTKFLDYGRKYKFSGVGNFVITQPGLDYSPSFGVNADFQTCNSQHGPNLSCIQNITYREPGIKVELVLPPQHNINTPKAEITVFVNDRVQKPTIGVTSASAFFGTDGTVLVFNHNDIEEPANFFCISVVGSQGLSVSLCQHEDNFAWLYVFPMPTLRNGPISQLYGLCNTYTGNLQKYLIARNGSLVGGTEGITYFGNSWNVTQPGVCAKDAVPFGEQCLTFSDVGDKRNWNSAVAACASKGRRLAKLKYPAEVLDYVLKTYPHNVHGSQQFWLGASDIANEGSWEWIDGQRLGGSFPWRKTGNPEPNGGRGENCLAVWNQPTHAYIDYGCQHIIRYICE